MSGAIEPLLPSAAVHKQSTASKRESFTWKASASFLCGVLVAEFTGLGFFLSASDLFSFHLGLLGCIDLCQTCEPFIGKGWCITLGRKAGSVHHV
jgi:hypothetical protein